MSFICRVLGVSSPLLTISVSTPHFFIVYLLQFQQHTSDAWRLQNVSNDQVLIYSVNAQLMSAIMTDVTVLNTNNHGNIATNETIFCFV